MGNYFKPLFMITLSEEKKITKRYGNTLKITYCNGNWIICMIVKGRSNHCDLFIVLDTLEVYPQICCFLILEHCGILFGLFKK